MLLARAIIKQLLTLYFMMDKSSSNIYICTKTLDVYGNMRKTDFIETS